MTRPQKESYMKREHRITIRLTDTEFSIIENSAEQAYMSISEYMRKQIMEGDRKSTRLNSSHASKSRMPSSA